MNKCKTCKKEYKNINNLGRTTYYCSRQCYYTSKKGNSKKGFRYSWGYKYLFMPNHPFANDGKYVAEHRLVIEKNIKRYLTNKEIVHHINGNKLDNNIKNLVLITRQKHGSIHNTSRIFSKNSKKKLRDACKKRPRNNKGIFI